MQTGFYFVLQAAYGVANKCDAMVSTVATWEQNSSLASLPTLHGHVTKYRSDLDRELPHEPYLNTVLWRLGWSCQPYTLTLEEVCKVGQQVFINKWVPCKWQFCVSVGICKHDMT